MKTITPSLFNQLLEGISENACAFIFLANETEWSSQLTLPRYKTHGCMGTQAFQELILRQNLFRMYHIIYSQEPRIR